MRIAPPGAAASFPLLSRLPYSSTSLNSFCEECTTVVGDLMPARKCPATASQRPKFRCNVSPAVTQPTHPPLPCADPSLSHADQEENGIVLLT